MINLRKNREMLRSALVASALFSVVLGGVACNNGASESPASTGGSDAKMATDKLAEAEPLYEGREDMTKARTAVTALRPRRRRCPELLWTHTAMFARGL